MTLHELRDRCRAWLDDPAHKPDFGHRDPAQDQFDLSETRVRIAEVHQACNALLRNAQVLRVLESSEAVDALLRDNAPG